MSWGDKYVIFRRQIRVPTKLMVRNHSEVSSGTMRTSWVVFSVASTLC